MTRHRLAIRIDDGAGDQLSRACSAFGVSRGAFVQALIEVAMEVFESTPDELAGKGPTVRRAREIDAERRDRS